MAQPEPVNADMAAADQDDESSRMSEKLSLQQKVALFMISPFGIAIEILTMILSLVSCGMYIGQTYYDDVELTPDMVKLLREFDIGDFSLTLYFLLVYALDAFTAEERLRWVLSPLALADFVTVFPPLIFFIPELFFSSSSVEFFGSLNFLRFIRILKILRIARLAKHLTKGDSDDVEVQKQLFSVTFMVFSIVFVFAGIFHLIENTFNSPELMLEKWGMSHLQFHDALYFTIVTVATVGFGDIYPLSVAGKFLVIILIATTIVIISNEVNTLFAMLALKSVYARNAYVPPKGSPPHVIICGFVDFTNLSSFLEEFYCEDHGDVEENVIVLSSNLPSVSVEFLLRMPRYRDRLFYLQGSALNERDLKRASCNTASTVFVLADQFSSDPFSHDSANILLCVSIRSFSVANNSNDHSCIHTILQLIRPESQHHFKNCQSSLYGNYQLLIIDQIRMGIFSKCCHCPGFSTLISNLVMSMSIESNPNMKEWLREYTAGAGWELYRVAISSFFEGTSFSRCFCLYNCFQKSRVQSSV
jgi:potassium large conductance calcium-activated channel subfamily M alpha protein 1